MKNLILVFLIFLMGTSFAQDEAVQTTRCYFTSCACFRQKWRNWIITMNCTPIPAASITWLQATRNMPPILTKKS